MDVCGPGSSDGIATDCGLDGPGIKSRWGRDFPPIQTGPGAHPASCTMGTRSFPGVKSGRDVLLTTHPLLVPRSWKSRAIPPPPPPTPPPPPPPPSPPSSSGPVSLCPGCTSTLGLLCNPKYSNECRINNPVPLMRSKGPLLRPCLYLLVRQAGSQRRYSADEPTLRTELKKLCF